MMFLTTRKALFILLPFLSISTLSYSENLSNLPGIYIERQTNDSEAKKNALKALYKQCVSLKRIMVKQYNEEPEFWKISSRSLSAEYVKNIKTIPLQNPPWDDEMVGFSREKEYFHQNQYVFIHEFFDYKISQDGLCILLKTKKEKKIIDTGKDIYHTNSRTAPRKIIPTNVVTDPWMDNNQYIQQRTRKHRNTISETKEARKNITNITKGNEEVFGSRLLALLQTTDGANAPAPIPTIKSKTNNSQKIITAINNLNNAIEESFALNTTPAPKKNHLPIAGPDYIAAGQSCDWVESETLSSKVCYWSASHMYPSELPRPIILKKEYSNMHSSAIRFIRINAIPKNLLLPPKNT